MVIPKMEIPVMIEINPCFLFAFKYLREKNVSKDTELAPLRFAIWIYGILDLWNDGFEERNKIKNDFFRS